MIIFKGLLRGKHRTLTYIQEKVDERERERERENGSKNGMATMEPSDATVQEPKHTSVQGVPEEMATSAAATRSDKSRARRGKRVL